MFFFDFVGFREDKLDGRKVRRWGEELGILKNERGGFWIVENWKAILG
jgi:hypothetical protein